jgi:phosphatidylserine decarboxylase
MNLAALLFHLFPKNLISWFTGTLARLKRPRPFVRWMRRTFAAMFKLNMAEAELALDSYASIEDLFTRRLKPGLRPIQGVVCSPADGYLARSAPAVQGQEIQAKGLDYDLKEFVYGAAEASSTFEAAWYQTVYLAPHNYHRVHAPFAGKLLAIRYLPGQLWPVNVPFVARIPRLFARNERLSFEFELKGGGKGFAVMVGAFNVGRMTTPLAPELITNDLSRQLGASPRTTTFDPPRAVAQGDELGTFMLGSTVIMVYDRAALEGLGIPLVQAEGNAPILMGHSLCR